MRKIYEIAREIRQDWEKPNYAAVPYIEAMSEISNIEDNYYCDSARSVVFYFLVNASTWKGEIARKIKKELNGMLK